MEPFQCATFSIIAISNDDSSLVAVFHCYDKNVAINLNQNFIIEIIPVPELCRMQMPKEDSIENHNNLLLNCVKNKMITQESSLKQKYHSPPDTYPLSKYRTHGLSQNISWAQALSTALIVSEMVVYFVCIDAMLQIVPLTAIYSIFGLVGIITSGLATFHNPTDWIVYYYKSAQKNKANFKYSYKELRFCSFCDSYCFKSSKHCRQCNRCVQNFDHHCIWFNNCVGSGNYVYFLLSISSLFVHLSIYIAHLIYATVYQANIGLGSQSIAKFVVAWIFGIILSIFNILILNLLGLHAYLNYEGITTYQFLNRQKQNQEQKDMLSKGLNKMSNSEFGKPEILTYDLIRTDKKKSIMLQNACQKSKVVSQQCESSLYAQQKNKNWEKDYLYHRQGNNFENQSSYANLNSEVIVVESKEIIQPETKRIKILGRENKDNQKSQIKTTNQQEGDSTRVIANESTRNEVNQSQENRFSKRRKQKNKRINHKTRSNQYQQKTKDRDIQKITQEKLQNQLNQQKQSQSQQKTVKSIELIQKDLPNTKINKTNIQYDMTDEILSCQIDETKSIKSHKSSQNSQKTIKKESRMKTFVAYTKNQDKIKKPSKQPQDLNEDFTSQKDVSKARNNLFRNYLRNNRSLKIILNSNNSEAYSPTKLPFQPKRQTCNQRANQNPPKNKNLRFNEVQMYFNQKDSTKSEK